MPAPTSPLLLQSSNINMASGRDWTTLPVDLLLLTTELLSVMDCIRLGAVCLSWNRTVATKLSPLLPWLMLPTGCDGITFDPFRNMETGSIPLLDDFFYLLGSTPQGHLIFHSKNMDLFVVNPLTGSRITGFPSLANLPKTTSFTRPPITKAIVTLSEPTAVAITYMDDDLSLQVAFARPRDDKWTLIGKQSERAARDIIFHKGLLHIVEGGFVVTWDLLKPSVQGIFSHQWGEKHCNMNDNCRKYLVESSAGGHLLMVHINLNEEFRVFKFEPRTPEWCRVTSLGDDALMLSPRNSMCIPTQEFPELRPNCIYSVLSHQGHNSPDLMRVHRLADGETEDYDLPYYSEMIDGHPLHWFQPSLYV